MEWIEGSRGLRFAPYGIAFVQEPVVGSSSTVDLSKPFSIRLEIRPRDEPRDSIPRILSAYDNDGQEFFFVGQWKTNLVIWILTESGPSSGRYRETETAGLRKDASRKYFLRFTDSGLTILDGGALLETAPEIRPSLIKRHRGTRLVLGNSPSGQDPWTGEITSLSILPMALSPQERVPLGPEPAIRYRFTEGRGTICRNEGSPGHDLVIPTRFRAPFKGVLAPTWKLERWNLEFWEDVVVNVFGFVPFGFVLFAWIRKSRPTAGFTAGFVAVCLGGIVSLVIELLQVYLPSRDSSLTDVITNVLGTWLGVMLCVGFSRVRSR